MSEPQPPPRRRYRRTERPLVLRPPVRVPLAADQRARAVGLLATLLRERLDGERKRPTGPTDESLIGP